MTAFLDGAYFVINYIIDMGASVMLPIIIAILSVCIGIKPGKAIRSGLIFAGCVAVWISLSLRMETWV